MSEADRQDTERVKILGELQSEVQGEVMVYQPMTIMEISHGGAQIESAFPIRLGSLHEVRLTLGATSVKGRVAHARVTEVVQQQVVCSSGIEFVEPTAEVLAAIDKFVTEMQATLEPSSSR
jgi:hypothetical protein